MKKKRDDCFLVGQKVTRIMKITTLLLLVGILHVSAGSYAQNKRISVTVEKGTFYDVISQIEKQSEFMFFYNSDEISNDKRISVDMKNTLVADVLNEITRNNDLSYKITGKHIIITRKENLFQVGREITGKVSDENGEAIIGATIVIQGMNTGVISDAEGKYTIDAAPNSMLLVTYMGYLPVEVATGNKTRIDIVMKEDLLALDEVVIIGYGANSKRNLTTAVSTVDAEKFKNLPVSSIADGLAGRAAGLIVTQEGGGINKKSKIRIRGGGTPLFVIDGIVSDERDWDNLNPEDVESLSILKDAAAAAVYGSRAGNGVIVIQTKGGRKGISVDYSFNQSWSTATFLEEKLDSYGRAQVDNDIRDIYNLEHKWTPEQLEKFRTGSDPYLYPNVDWQKLVLKDYAPESKHSLTMRGGSDFNKYYVSFQAYNQKSMYTENTNWLKRYNVRMSETSEFTSIGLKLHFGLDGYITKIHSPQSIYGNSYYHTWGHTQNKSPMDLAYNEFGQFTDYGDHPLVEISPESGYSETTYKTINGLFNAEWKVPGVNGLKLRGGGNYRFYISNHKSWNKTAPQYTLDGHATAAKQMSLSYSNADARQYTLQFFADYQRSFLDETHNISATAGYEQSYYFGTDIWLKRRDFQFPIDQMSVGPSNTMENSGEEREEGRAGYVARLGYDYKHKYYIEGSLRHDGSDHFPKDKRWGTFFAGSLAYAISEESFFQPLKDKNILNFFKIRGSYGEVGLDEITPFSYVQSYKLQERQYVMNGQLVPIFVEGDLVSPDITWYTSKMTDIGFDFTSLDSRLAGSFDYFYIKTTGFLTSPSAVGYSDPLGMSLPKVKSNGELRRAGFEVALSWKDNVGALAYEVGGNFTYFDELVARAWDESITDQMNPYRRKVQKKGYYRNDALINQGYYKNSDDVLNSPYREGSYNLVAGDIKYKDINGDGFIDGNDKTYIGKNRVPRGNYGIYGNFSYKGFFGNILFQGGTSRDLYLDDVVRSGPGGYMITYPYQLDYWMPDNRSAKYPRPMMNSSENGNHNYTESDFWLVNGRYFRLKSLQVGYNFKTKLIRKISWINKLELVLSGQNLFTISPATKYGLDPETGSTNNYDYPVQRVYALSVNIGF